MADNGNSTLGGSSPAADRSTISAPPWDSWVHSLTQPAMQAVQANAATLLTVSTRIADALAASKHTFVFGAGHASMFAMELYGRAGGLSSFKIMHLEDLTDLKRPAGEYMMDQEPERDPKNGQLLAEHYGIDAGDVVLIASNSGRNGAIVQLAMECRRLEAHCVAVTSIQHSSQVQSRHPSGHRLYEVADETIDNCCPLGDATLADPRLEVRYGATSSISFCLLAQVLNALVVQTMLLRGLPVDVLASANVRR